MKLNSKLVIHVDRKGHLILPPELASLYGLKPGSDIYLNEKSNSIELLRPITHLNKVYIEPTNMCNLECRTCIRHSWEEPPGKMDSKTFGHILKSMSTLDSSPVVFFGGFGEPLSHPGIIDMVAGAKNSGSRVELITNGTLLSQKMSKDLIRAGLDMLWVSLDGATQESYADVRLGAALPNVLANLRGFSEMRRYSSYGLLMSGSSGLQIGIVFVAMKRNIGELPYVVNLGNRIGANHFLVTNVLPYTVEMCREALYSRSLSDLAFLSPAMFTLQLPKIDIDTNTTEGLFWMMPGGRTMSFGGANFAESINRCPFVSQGATAVSWDGNLVPCLPLLHDHTSFLNERERFSKRHVIGNVADKGIADLWNHDNYTALRDRVQRFDFSPCAFCGGCDLSEKNQEDCIGNTAPTCGGCLWAQGIIQCP